MALPTRRKIVLTYKVIHSWLLAYFATANVGLMVFASGWITGRENWIRLGLWLTAPFLLLLGWLVMVLIISATVNMAILLWTGMKRIRNRSN